MENDLYSVEQVADLLGLHVRTVRNYVREGRLKAVRIGKQYRIARADVESFTGQPLVTPSDIRRTRFAEVSSVVSIDAISPADASRVSNTLMAALNGPNGSDQPTRVDAVYDAERGRLKVILTGSLSTVASLTRMIAALTGTDEI